jgi:predicted alpha/beta hydrolase
MSARNVESLHGQYAGAPRTMVRLAPAEVGVARIGHFGCFRPAMAGPLWERHLLPRLA